MAAELFYMMRQTLQRYITIFFEFFIEFYTIFFILMHFQLHQIQKTKNYIQTN